MSDAGSNENVYTMGYSEEFLQFGIASREQFDRWRAELDRWDGHPGSIAAIAFGEAVGFKA